MKQYEAAALAGTSTHGSKSQFHCGGLQLASCAACLSGLPPSPQSPSLRLPSRLVSGCAGDFQPHCFMACAACHKTIKRTAAFWGGTSCRWSIIDPDIVYPKQKLQVPFAELSLRTSFAEAGPSSDPFEWCQKACGSPGGRVVPHGMFYIYASQCVSISKVFCAGSLQTEELRSCKYDRSGVQASNSLRS